MSRELDSLWIIVKRLELLATLIEAASIPDRRREISALRQHNVRLMAENKFLRKQLKELNSFIEAQ